MSFTTEEEQELTTTMEDVELTEEEVLKHLYNLGRSPAGLQPVYKALSISKQNLKNVSILCNYIHLTKLELSHNKITDLSCVNHMPYLLTLDASHNELSDFFGFQPPRNLKVVDFSHNHISSMKDLSAYTSLQKLILDYNFISEIQGLKKCSSMTYLSIAHNKIQCISGLDNLPLRRLYLSGNLIKKIENLQPLQSLQILDLSSNEIQSLSGLQTLYLLRSINLESNMIEEIKEAIYVQDLHLLSDLNLKGNPIQEQPDYKLAVFFLLQHLSVLDEEPITAEEKVSAVNKYDPPLELVAARDHMTHIIYHHMQPQVIFDSTLPSLDTPYPMLVLVGPRACGKRELAHKLCHEFSDYFAYGACHTTRGPYFGEEDGCDYHFVQEDEFQHMMRMGNFVQTMQYEDNWYGLSRDAIECVAREGLACCVHMELEGVFSLKNSYFEPRYILLMPTRTEDYCSLLKARGFYTNIQIEKALSRINLYAKINRERPGFFDCVIPCDNQEEAYCSLRQLVKEYMGLEEQKAECEMSARVTPENASTYESSGSMAPNKLDSCSRNYCNKVQASLAPQKNSAEVASICRKQQMVREALLTMSPAAYTQLFKRYIHTTPLLLTSHSQPSSSSLPDRNEDSSSEESCASSGLSIQSSAALLSVGSPAEPLIAGSGPKVELLDISPLGQNLESTKDNMESAPIPDSPRSGLEQVSPTVVSSPGRPGSNTKSVLPPIPFGRKAIEPDPRSELIEHSEQVDEG